MPADLNISKCLAVERRASRLVEQLNKRIAAKQLAARRLRFVERLNAAYDWNARSDATTRVTHAEILEYIDAYSVDRPPHHPTTAIAWDLQRTFGERDGRRLLLRASRQWDAQPLRAREVVRMLWEDDYTPQGWVDEYLSDALAKRRDDIHWQHEREARKAENNRALIEPAVSPRVAKAKERIAALERAFGEGWRPLGDKKWPDPDVLAWCGLFGAWSEKHIEGVDAIVAHFESKLSQFEQQKQFAADARAGKIPMPAQSANAMPLLSGTQATIDEGLPAVASFNALHTAVAADAPRIPVDLHAAALREPLQAAVDRVVAMADVQRAAFKIGDAAEMLAVLATAYRPTFDATIARMRASGAILPDGKLQNAIGAFEAQVQRTSRTSQGWILDGKGRPDPWISENVDVFLSRDKTELRFNVFARQKEFSRKDGPWRQLTDDDIRAVSHEARSLAHQFNVSKSHLTESLTTIARRRTYDPPMDYVDSLQWDGVPRLDTWLGRACGVPDDAYHRAVACNVIGGMVRRIRHPGCKHDTTMLLISPLQGTGKSSPARCLVPDETWFTDNLNLKLSPQNLLPTLDGKLVVEWAELASMRKTEVEDVKAFLTRQSDNYTKKFDVNAGDHPRRYIFIATSNDSAPLRDDTGNRRFLPVHVVGRIDLAWLVTNRDALIAEAAHRETAGERFAIPEDVWEVAAEHQSAARAATPAEALIDDWFGGLQGKFWVASGDITEALRHHGVRDAKWGPACKRAGLLDVRFKFDGKPQARAWAMPDTTEADPRVRVTIEGGVVRWKWPVFSAAQAPR